MTDNIKGLVLGQGNAPTVPPPPIPRPCEMCGRYGCDPEHHTPLRPRWEGSIGQLHRDSVADTYEAYTQFQGWVLSCLWCDYQARGKTKRVALALMQKHYARFGLEVHA